MTADSAEETRCLHLSHALWQVGWNSGKSFPSAVHDVVTARAHGRARTSADAARLKARGLLVAWEEKRKMAKYQKGNVKLIQVCECGMTLSRIMGCD